MNRVIKFRAVSRSGIMVYGYLVDCQFSDGIGFGIKDTISHVNDGLIDLIPTMIVEDTIGQLTGLKDKNGKDIYEGDVVHIEKNRFKSGGDEVWTVEYNETHAKFICFNQLNSDRDIDFDCNENCAICNVTDSYEFLLGVAGNIHENPELLQQGQPK